MIKETFEKLTPEQKQVIIDIQKSIPTEWLKAVTRREKIAPTSKLIMEKALLDPDVSEELKKEFKAVLGSGYFEKEIDVEVPEVAQLIDAYVEKEMIKAVIAKKLPKPKKRKSFETIYKRFNLLLSEYEKYKNNIGQS